MVELNSDKLLNHLKLKWKNQVCPMCNQSAWNISNIVFELRQFQGGGLVIGGSSNIIPITPVTCTNCGNTILLNTMLVDDSVIKKQEESK